MFSHRQASVQTRRSTPDERKLGTNAADAQDPAGGVVLPERALQLAAVAVTSGQSAASATVLGDADGLSVLVSPTEQPVIPAAAALGRMAPVGARVSVQSPSCHSPGHAGVKAAVAILTDSTCVSTPSGQAGDQSLSTLEIPSTSVRAIAAPACATLATASEVCAGLSSVSSEAHLVASSATATAVSLCGAADEPNGKAVGSAAPEEVILVATATEDLAGLAGNSADAHSVAGSVDLADVTSDAVAGDTASLSGTADEPNGRSTESAAPEEIILLTREHRPVCEPPRITAPAHGLFSSGAREQDTAGVGRQFVRPGLDGVRAPGMSRDDLGGPDATAVSSAAGPIVAHAASSIFLAPASLPASAASPASTALGFSTGALPLTDLLVAVGRRVPAQRFSDISVDVFAPGFLAPSSFRFSSIVGLIGVMSCPAPPQHWPVTDGSECLVSSLRSGPASIWMFAPLKALCAAPTGSAARFLGDTWMTARSRLEMRRRPLARNSVMQYAPMCTVLVDFSRTPPAILWRPVATRQAAPAHAVIPPAASAVAVAAAATAAAAAAVADEGAIASVPTTASVVGIPVSDAAAASAAAAIALAALLPPALPQATDDSYARARSTCQALAAAELLDKLAFANALAWEAALQRPAKPALKCSYRDDAGECGLRFQTPELLHAHLQARGHHFGPYKLGGFEKQEITGADVVEELTRHFIAGQHEPLDALMRTGRNIILAGRAGTGKTVAQG